MVTTIGIDPHKATHTAVAIDETEMVLGELTLPADRSQTKTLLDWAQSLDGDGRVWAVEAAGGLGYLLSRQLVVHGEHVVGVPRCLPLGFGYWGRADHRRTIPTMPCRWRSPRYVNPTSHQFGGRTMPRCYRCWRNVTSSSPL